jgi:hypothetical protein
MMCRYAKTTPTITISPTDIRNRRNTMAGPDDGMDMEEDETIWIEVP